MNVFLFFCCRRQKRGKRDEIEKKKLFIFVVWLGKTERDLKAFGTKHLHLMQSIN